MPTTSNFGWTTPADTDLVKDGAAAIRTLGNGIDTSFLDLKGGTTGQILSKASNTDLDYTWIANDQGDITEVQAGTGISVASGTGPVPVVTNTVATTFDAKGDLVVGTGADTFAKLSVGTNGYQLVADSVETTGLKWVAPSAGASFSGAVAYKTSAQSIANTTETLLTWDSEYLDVGSYHSTVTNTGRMTVPSTGYYFVYAKLRWGSNATGYRYFYFKKNGTQVQQDLINYPPSSNPFSLFYSVVTSATAGDYFEVFAAQSSGGSLNVNGTDDGGSLFGIYYIGA